MRILGEVTPERVSLLQRADAIFMEEIRAAGLYDEIAQAFAVLLPVRTVGVMGDQRTYENVAALRAVTTEDFMTADWDRFPPRRSRPGGATNRQRDSGDQPGGVRRHVQTPRHDRVGVTGPRGPGTGLRLGYGTRRPEPGAL